MRGTVIVSIRGMFDCTLKFSSISVCNAFKFPQDFDGMMEGWSVASRTHVNILKYQHNRWKTIYVCVCACVLFCVGLPHVVVDQVVKCFGI